MLVRIKGLDAHIDVVLRVLNGIVYQVGDGLGHILFVSEDVFYFEVYADLDGLCGLGLRLLHEIIDDRLQVYLVLVQDELFILQLRDGQQLVDKCQQVLSLFLNNAVIFLLDLRFVVHLAAMQEVGTHNDR